jgi:hypothetical protein
VFLITYGTAAPLSFWLGILDLGWIPQNFIPLTTAAIIFSSALAGAAYLASFLPQRLLSEHGKPGSFLRDFWFGRELNPRAFELDIKVFCKLYPGMIGWGLLNLTFAYQQYQQLDTVSREMMLVNFSLLVYIFAMLRQEPTILTTVDITTDGFGSMTVLRDLVLVPFMFSTQVRAVM